MVFGTSNRTVFRAVQDTQQQNFKTVNNLLTLQDNHVEEFLQYHGEAFFATFEKLIEDVVERVVSQMLVKLEFRTETTSGHIKLVDNALREYESITQENIDLDIQRMLGAALNEEVVLQRKMAKQQYLESQGFAPQTPSSGGNVAIQGQPQMQQFGQPQGQPAGSFANDSGYPVSPSGYDQMNNPYWIDQQTGQMTYTAPTGGLHLAQNIGKVAAWAKWLA
tara:strand:+ start:2165 stop:2827 length:663 start_codon:yes stop_codon:yes gene_type:complete